MRLQALRRLILGAAAAATLVAGMNPLSAATAPSVQSDAHQDSHPACTVARQSNAQALAEARDPVQREAAYRNRLAVPCDIISTGQIAAWAVVASAGALAIALLAKGRGHGRGTGLSR